MLTLECPSYSSYCNPHQYIARVSRKIDDSREEMVMSKLGLNGWRRLTHFRYSYLPGWGDGSGKPLSAKSLELFYRFVQDMTLSAGGRPSLFLTSDGTLELCWSDPSGNEVELEFTPTGIEYFFEATCREGIVPPENVRELASQLAARRY
jgi:hypothetical protein